MVSTPLKNISQWEGVSHILWKKMFQTTNQMCTFCPSLPSPPGNLLVKVGKLCPPLEVPGQEVRRPAEAAHSMGFKWEYCKYCGTLLDGFQMGEMVL